MNKKLKQTILIAGCTTYLIGSNIIIHDYHKLVGKLNTKLGESIHILESVQANTTKLEDSIQIKDEQLKQLKDIAEKYYKQQAELKKLSSIVISANPSLDIATADAIANAIQVYSVKYDVPKSEILAVIKTESNFTPTRVGSSKDRGLMQIIPSTEKEIVGDLDLHNYDIFNVNTNIEMGTYYIHKLKEHYGKYAYIVYNQGFTKPLTQTTYDYCMSNGKYIHKVLSLSNKYKEEI